MSARKITANVVRIHCPLAPFAARAIHFKVGDRSYYVTGCQHVGHQLFGPDDGAEVVEETGETVRIPYEFVMDAVAQVNARDAGKRMRTFLKEHQEWFRNPTPVSV